MSRADKNNLVNQADATLANPLSCELENILEHSLSFNKCEYESSSCVTSVKKEFSKLRTTMKDQAGNAFLDNKKNGCREIVLCINDQCVNDDIKAINNENSCPQEGPSKQQEPPVSWMGENNLKIRYTRRYLLDRRFEPQSMAFPDCLLEYLQSDEVPLRQEENCYDQKSMDHILFYTSLPYRKRKPFAQRYH